MIAGLYCQHEGKRGLARLTFAFLAALSGFVIGIPAGAQILLGDPLLAFDTVVTGLATPTTMAFLGPGDILVLQKNNGQVRRVLNGVLQPTPVLDVAVANASEEGLLGIAINTENPPKVFLYYTASTVDGGTPLGNRIYRYTWNPGNPPDPDAGRLESPQLLRALPATPGPNHDGGFLLLGPPEAGLAGDGRSLYAAIGDLNRTGQLQNFAAGSAPDDTGVILRLQQNGAAHPANPFVSYCSVAATICAANSDCPSGQTCVTTVASYLAYGVRNSFGLAIDPVTGALWDTENGPANYDEVNLVAPGFNSGWRRIMGPALRDAEGAGDLFDMPGPADRYSDPEFSWRATIAPTAILFAAGSSLGAAYDNVVLVGDSNNGNLYRFPLNATRDGFVLSAGLADLVADSVAERDQLKIGSGFNGVVDLTLGPDGAVYLVSIGAGSIYRIHAASHATSTPTPTAIPPPTHTSSPAATRTPSTTPRPTASFTATASPIGTPMATSTTTPTRAPTPVPCVGDCSDSGQVTIDEILTTVDIALGNRDPSLCGPGDRNGDGHITIDEILAAIRNAADGCSAMPGPQRSRTALTAPRIPTGARTVSFPIRIRIDIADDH